MDFKKKIGKALTSKSVGTGPSSYEKKNLPGRGLTKVEKHCYNEHGNGHRAQHTDQLANYQLLKIRSDACSCLRRMRPTSYSKNNSMILQPDTVITTASGHDAVPASLPTFLRPDLPSAVCSVINVVPYKQASTPKF